MMSIEGMNNFHMSIMLFKDIFLLKRKITNQLHLFSPAVSIGFLCQFLHLFFINLSLSYECHHQLCCVPEADVVSHVESARFLPDQSGALLHHPIVIFLCKKLAFKQVPGQKLCPADKSRLRNVICLAMFCTGLLMIGEVLG